MKAEIELTVDEVTGEPKIKIRHHDRSNALEQKLLKIFINKSEKYGIKLVHTSGYLEMGTTNSHEDYEIKIRN